MSLAAREPFWVLTICYHDSCVFAVRSPCWRVPPAQHHLASSPPLAGVAKRDYAPAMPKLVSPTTALHTSFLSALEEYQGEGRYQDLDGALLRDANAFAQYVTELCAQAVADTPRPAGRVPATTLWWVDDNEYVGRISIRHSLTDDLRRVGGHIGYEVRPSARGCGHATQMLAAALPVAAALGIDPALVTCDAANIASRRVIERNGGQLENEGDGELHFWVPTT
jgi:predicted acetyltransferase